MSKKVYVEMEISKSVIIDLTGCDVDMTNPKSVEEYVNLYASDDLECHEEYVDYSWSVTAYNVVDEKRKKKRRK